MAASRVCRGWVEAGLVGFACTDCLSHFVIDFEDDAFGAVFAVLFFVLSADDGEGVHDVDHAITSSGSGLGNFIMGLLQIEWVNFDPKTSNSPLFMRSF